MLRHIKRDQVRLGMYIHGFEGAWLRHPFWRTRFRLKKPDDLVRILESDITGVVIDESRGIPLAPPERVAAETPGAVAGGRLLPQALLGLQRECGFAEERERATQIVRKATAEMKRLFGSAHKGQAFTLEDVTPIVCDIMTSVSRNPHALVAITRLKRRDEYTYVHSLAVSALMTRFARSLGLSEFEVFELSVAGLLHDIGKMIVPGKVLNKPGALSDEEFALVRTHPEQGHVILGQIPDVPWVVLDVCRHHHERLDGTGYPFRLKGDAISRAARIAAICDVFDALTSNRAYKAAWSAEEAISRMVEWSGHFDHDLLFAFMRAMGVYPPGALVRLRSNRLAVTLPNGRRSSRPRVRAFYCTRERVQLPLEDLVLDDRLSHDQVVGEEYPLDWGFTSWILTAEQLMDGVVPVLGAQGGAKQQPASSTVSGATKAA